MKTLAISLTLASLFASTSVFAAEATNKVSLQTQKYQIAAAPSQPERDTGKRKPASDSKQSSEAVSAMPDSSFMPYMNNGHYEAN